MTIAWRCLGLARPTAGAVLEGAEAHGHDFGRLELWGSLGESCRREQTSSSSR